MVLVGKEDDETYIRLCQKLSLSIASSIRYLEFKDEDNVLFWATGVDEPARLTKVKSRMNVLLPYEFT